MDAQNICRTCLKLSDCEFEKKPCNTNIREFCDFIGPENLTIGEIIKLITSIEITATQNLSTHICIECIQQAINAFKFRIDTINADFNIREKYPDEFKIETNCTSDTQPETSPDNTSFVKTECFIKCEQDVEFFSNTDDAFDDPFIEPEVINKQEDTHENDSEIIDKIDCIEQIENIQSKPKRGKRNSTKEPQYSESTNPDVVVPKRKRNKKVSNQTKTPILGNFNSIPETTNYSVSTELNASAVEVPQKRPRKRIQKPKEKIDHLPPTRVINGMLCPYCPIIKTRNSEILRHIKEEHLKTEVPFRRLCTICGQSFTSRSVYDTHYKRHFPERMLCCQFCDKKFSVTYHLRRHERCHTKEKPYMCDKCDYAGTTLQQLNNHYLNHTGDRPFACELCPGKFKTFNSRKRHIHNTHLNLRPFKCDLCFKTFKERGELNRHLKRHERDGDIEGEPE